MKREIFRANGMANPHAFLISIPAEPLQQLTSGEVNTMRARIVLSIIASALAISAGACMPGGIFVEAPLPLPPPRVYPLTATPPSFQATELERIVAPVALYPDPLLAQVLAASTFLDDIPEAARWADDHHHLAGSRLTNAIAADDLEWDPSVQALLPFPSVLEKMAKNMEWTEQLGDAFLAEPAAVMDAVQRMRERAWSYGYLNGCDRVVVRRGPWLELMPVNPMFITVPYYDPDVVFVPPPPGYVGRAVYCGYGITIGAWFGPWGWGGTYFDWSNRWVFINRARWGRTWDNRTVYVHPSPLPHRVEPRPPERHPPSPRTPKERAREQPKNKDDNKRAQPKDQQPSRAQPKDKRP
jgi:hypothetical protein